MTPFLLLALTLRMPATSSGDAALVTITPDAPAHLVFPPHTATFLALVDDVPASVRVEIEWIVEPTISPHRFATAAFSGPSLDRLDVDACAPFSTGYCWFMSERGYWATVRAAGSSLRIPSDFIEFRSEPGVILVTRSYLFSPEKAVYILGGDGNGISEVRWTIRSERTLTLRVGTVPLHVLDDHNWPCETEVQAYAYVRPMVGACLGREHTIHAQGLLLAGFVNWVGVGVREDAVTGPGYEEVDRHFYQIQNGPPGAWTFQQSWAGVNPRGGLVALDIPRPP